MLGVVGLVAALVVLALSLLVTRLATVALTHTGLSEEVARFQSRSAFTGTGFTSRETEEVVGHPVRRRVIMSLMVLRSAGIVSILVSLILSFGVAEETANHLARLLWLVGGVLVLLALAMSRAVNRLLEHVITWTLGRWTDLDTRDYMSLLKLSGEYTVMEVHVREGEWLAGRTLQDCELRREGVTVLGINREDGSYVGAPRGSTEVWPGDTLILYGRQQTLKKLDMRGAGIVGDLQHRQAVDEQQEGLARQDMEETSRRLRRKQDTDQEAANRQPDN